MNNPSEFLRKSSNPNMKLYISQGEIQEDPDKPKIFRTTSLQKSKFPHKHMVSLISDQKTEGKAMIFSLSQKNFRTQRKDSIDEKLLTSVLMKKKNKRPSEGQQRKIKNETQKQSKSLNNSEIENNIISTNDKMFSPQTNNFFFKNNISFKNNPQKKDFEIKHTKTESENFSDIHEFNNSYLHMKETHEDNFFEVNDSDNFLMDSQINLERFSHNNRDSANNNELFLDVVSPINPLNNFKKKTNNLPSKDCSQDFGYLFEKRNENLNEEDKQFKHYKDERKMSEISAIPIVEGTKRSSNLIFGGEFTPMHKLSLNTEINSQELPETKKTSKYFKISNEKSNTNEPQQTIQNISFKNFSTLSKEKIPSTIQKHPSSRPKITDLLNILIEKNSESEDHLSKPTTDPSKEKLKSIGNELDEFDINNSIVDIQSTTNINTVFDFKDVEGNASDISYASQKNIKQSESIQKLSLFQKESTANMFEHYQPPKEEKNIFRDSSDDINDVDIEEEKNILSSRSSQWNMSHINLEGESYLEEHDSDNEENKKALDEEYYKLIQQKQETNNSNNTCNQTSNFTKKESSQKLNFKESKLAKKIVRQSRKKQVNILKKNISLPKSVHTIKTLNSNSGHNDSTDKKKLSLKSKLKNSMAGSTKKSLYSRNLDHENLYKKSSHGSHSKLDRTIGSGSLKTKESFKSHLGFYGLNNSNNDGSNSKTKLLKNLKSKNIIKSQKNTANIDINDRLQSKLSQPDLFNKNITNKIVSLRRSHTQKNNQIKNDNIRNKTEELSKPDETKTPKKFTNLKLKLSKTTNVLKKKNSIPNSKTSSHQKIYSVDKLLNTNPSSTNFENIYKKEIIEQRSKETTVSKSERFSSDKKSEVIPKYQFNIKDSIHSSFNEIPSPIPVNIKSPYTDNKSKNMSSNQESIKSSKFKWNKQTTHNSTFLPFPRSISIKNKDELASKSIQNKVSASKDETSESNIDGKNTDPITFTEGEEISNDVSTFRENKKILNQNIPDEYGIISDDEQHEYYHQSNIICKDSKDLSDQSNQVTISNKSDQVYIKKKKSILNHSHKVKTNKFNKKNSNKNEYSTNTKEKFKKYSCNFQQNDNLSKLIESNEFLSKNNSHSNINQYKKKLPLNNLKLPTKPKISKSGKNISIKKSFHNISKKSSTNLKNLSNLKKNIFPTTSSNFNKTISNLSEKIPNLKKIRFSLNQSTKDKRNERYKTKDKKNFEENKIIQNNLSFSKPMPIQKQNESSFNQSSLLGKTFESDVIPKSNKPKKKKKIQSKYSSKLKSIKQERFRTSSNFQKMIEMKKDIEKRTKNYLMPDKKLSHKKINNSYKKIDSHSQNEIPIDKCKQSYDPSEENNIPSFRNFYPNSTNDKFVQHQSNNVGNNFYNINKVNINNLVKNEETHNYIIVHSKDYDSMSGTPSFMHIKSLYKTNDSGNNCLLYNSFEHNEKLLTIQESNSPQQKISKGSFEGMNERVLLSNDPSKAVNTNLFLVSEDIIENEEPIRYNKLIKDSQKKSANLSKSLNLQNFLEKKNSLLESKQDSKRNSVINSQKNYDKKEFNLRKKIKQIKSQRKIKIDKTRSSKELKKEYYKIKNQKLKQSTTKCLKPNKKSLFFNKYNNSEQLDSIYQRYSTNLDQQSSYNKLKTYQHQNWKEDNMLHEDYNDINQPVGNPIRATTRTSLRCSSINNKKTKRNTSLEAVLQKHSLKFISDEQTLLKGINNKVKNWYNLDQHLYNKSQFIIKNQVNKGSFNETTSIASLSNIEKRINKKLNPLKKIKGPFNKEYIRNNSVEHKSAIQTKFNTGNKFNFKLIKSVKNTHLNISKDPKKESFNFKKDIISSLKESMLKRKLQKKNTDKEGKKEKYYCSSNIDNPDFNSSNKDKNCLQKIFKSTVFESKKIKPKLSKISLSQKNKLIYKKLSPQNIHDLIQNSHNQKKLIKSITAKPTPLRYTFSNQSHSLRGSNQKQREGFFSISSQEKHNNMTEIPSSSDNITNSSIHSQKKSKLSDINIYNNNNSLINTSGSNCEIIYKQKPKKLLVSHKISKSKTESAKEDKHLKFGRFINKDSHS